MAGSRSPSVAGSRSSRIGRSGPTRPGVGAGFPLPRGPPAGLQDARPVHGRLPSPGPCRRRRPDGGRRGWPSGSEMPATSRPSRARAPFFVPDGALRKPRRGKAGTRSRRPAATLAVRLPRVDDRGGREGGQLDEGKAKERRATGASRGGLDPDRSPSGPAVLGPQLAAPLPGWPRGAAAREGPALPPPKHAARTGRTRLRGAATGAGHGPAAPQRRPVPAARCRRRPRGRRRGSRRRTRQRTHRPRPAYEAQGRPAPSGSPAGPEPRAPRRHRFPPPNRRPRWAMPGPRASAARLPSPPPGMTPSTGA